LVFSKIYANLLKNYLFGFQTETMKFYSKKPKPSRADCFSAKGVILANGNSVLLLQKPNGRWDLPGGKLEDGEGWMDGLTREILEESGIEIKTADWVAGWSDEKGKQKPVFRGVFLCDVAKNLIKTKICISTEHIASAFVPLKKLHNLNLRMEYRHTIALAVEKSET
jgi:8-oxo-dGTP pyrophosphatase MutT (NUDIX family)